MTTTTPSPTTLDRGRRTRLVALGLSAVLLLGACGASSGDDLAEAKADADPTTTEATTTVEAEPEPVAQPDTTTTTAAADPIAAPVVFGDVLFETDLSDPAVGGFALPPSGVSFLPTGLTLDLPANTELPIAPLEERFEENVHVAAMFDVGLMDVGRDLNYGVGCRVTGSLGYKGYVTESETGGYRWAIYKDTEDGLEELAVSEEPAEVVGALLYVGLSCTRTDKGEQLQLLVGAEVVGTAFDLDLDTVINGRLASALVGTTDTASRAYVRSFSVTELVDP